MMVSRSTITLVHFKPISTLALICFLFLAEAAAQQSLSVSNLKCESRKNPIGVESPAPELSWEINSDGKNILQSAYQIIVAESPEKLNSNDDYLWNSKKVLSEVSIHVPYSGPALLSARKYYWKVRTWDQLGNASAWSDPGFWQMGLLAKAEWKAAQWITYEELPPDKQIIPAVHFGGDPKWGPGRNILPLIRREFTVQSQLKQATVFISGLGHFDLSINGEKSGDHFLDPGWTQYDKHALYVGFDVTNQLQEGKNTLGVMLGNGFYYVPRERYRKLTSAFGYPKVIFRLILEYNNGRVENVISDKTCKTAPGPIIFSSIYGGEDYDARLEQKGWNATGFSDTAWSNVLVTDGPPVLNAQMEEPLKIFENFSPLKITQPKPGIWVYDMGQNASAIPAIRLRGKPGSKMRLVPGELLNDDGTVNQSASGQPHYYEYTLRGDSVESWQPQFTYYGFRYIQVHDAVPENKDNPSALPVILEMKSLHIRNAAEQTGSFTSSNDLFNRTHALIDWAIRSNMVSVLTDCPHREKLGWLEEVHLMGSSVRYRYDISALSRKLVRDMMVAQTSEGLIPDIAPEYVHFEDGFRDSPEWGSSGVILPWYLYKWYGDTQTLRKAYPMMQRYVSYLQKKAKDHIVSHGLGDWFDIGPKTPGESQLTPKALTATAIYYYDISILAETANLLNKKQDVERYRKQASEVKAAFNKKFFNKETGQYATGSQTSNAMAVYMELVEPEYKQTVINNLVKNIRENKNGLTAGDIGYRYVLLVLNQAGRSDVIFDMNSRSDVPGYGWQLSHGATALTESWQAYGFVSNNHFMLGHLMEWLYSGLAGITQEKNTRAYKTIVLKPQVVGDVTEAKAAIRSPYGNIVSEWKNSSGNFHYHVEIPCNTSAHVYLPYTEKTSEKEKKANIAKGARFVRHEKGFALYKIGSGIYDFSSSMNTIQGQRK